MCVDALWVPVFHCWLLRVIAINTLQHDGSLACLRRGERTTVSCCRAGVRARQIKQRPGGGARARWPAAARRGPWPCPSSPDVLIVRRGGIRGGFAAADVPRRRTQWSGRRDLVCRGDGGKGAGRRRRGWAGRQRPRLSRT